MQGPKAKRSFSLVTREGFSLAGDLGAGGKETLPPARDARGENYFFFFAAFFFAGINPHLLSCHWKRVWLFSP
jgi:hypothetical protein